MAINKNFVIKNGIQVSTDLIIGDTDNNKVGIGTTIPGYDLHVGRGRKSRGGIGATDLVVTGVATVTNLNVTGISTFAGALDVNSTVDFAGDVVFNGTNDITFDQSESALVLNDGAALRVGTGSDFSISHDGNNTILRDNGTGDLQIYASRIELGGASVDETIAMFTENGGAQLFFNNVNKFETTGVGATVFGDLVVSGVTTSARLLVTGISTFSDNVDVNAHVFVGTGVTIQSFGGVSIAGITTVGGNLLAGGDILPDDDGARDLGSSSKEFEDLHIDGTAHIDVLDVDETAFVTTKLTVGTGVTIQSHGAIAAAGIATFGSSVLVGGDITPDTDGSFDLGSSSKEFQDLHIDGTAHIDTLDVDESAFVTTTLTVGTGLTVHPHGNLAVAGIATIGGNLLAGGDILPDDDGARDLGSSSKEFQDLFIDGTANIDSLAADTAAIGDLTSGRVVLAGTSGELEDSSNLRFDGGNLVLTGDIAVSSKVTAGTGATIFATTGNAAFAGIVTANGGVNVGTGVTMFPHGGVAIAGITTIGGTMTVSPSGNDRISVTADTVNLSVEDNTTNAFTLKQASNEYITVDTNNSSELLTFGNTTTNPNTLILGGKTTVGTGVTIQGHGGVSIAGITTVGDNLLADGLKLGDGKQIIAGVGSDLAVFSDGSTSFLKADDLRLRSKTGSEDYINCTVNGAVVLFHDDAARVTTTTDGTDFGGTGSIRVPNGTTGQRNASPAAGDFRYNTTTGKFEGYTDEWGDIGGSGGVEETSTSVSTTSATSTGSFATASFRSASIIAQITQGSAYQVGRYLLIHDGTTVTTIEESAVATGDMLGTFEGVINGSNVEFRVTMGSSSSATVKTKIDTVTV